jgi:hypothetical protein
MSCWLTSTAYRRFRSGSFDIVRWLAALIVFFGGARVASAAPPAEEPVVDALPPVQPLLQVAQKTGLFDTRDAAHYSGLGLDRIFARPETAQHYGPGIEVRFADQLVWTRSIAQLESTFGGSLRLLPHGYALSVAQSGGVAGVRLGPFEFKAGVSLSILNVDTVLSGWDLSMFWPRSMAGVCLTVGGIRVDVLAHVEYLWRWFGPDEYVRGIGVMVSLKQGPLGPMFR